MNGFGYINDITEFLDKLISNPCNMNKTYFMNLDSLRNDEAQEFPTSQSCVCFRIPGYT